MRKCLILVLMLITIPLMSCGGAESSSNPTRDAIESGIQAKAAVECYFSYADVKNVLASCTTIDDNGDGTYDVKGYITVVDDYGDKYKGKFDATATSTGHVEYFSLETPTRE